MPISRITITRPDDFHLHLRDGDTLKAVAAHSARQFAGAGCHTAATALELYAEAFAAADALDKLEAFASFNGADFYRLPRNRGTVTLEKRSRGIPAAYDCVDGEQLVPLRAGEALEWTRL